MVGREREVDALERALTSACTFRQATVVHIRGISGIGKTTILRHLEQMAIERGMETCLAQCHRSERELPHLCAERLALENLPSRSADAPTALLIDDAPNMDEPSARLFDRMILACARQPLFVAVTERIGDGDIPVAAVPALTVTLDRLNEFDAATLVRRIYDAPVEIIEAILSRSVGLPLELVILAHAAADRAATTPDDVPTSVDAHVAATLHHTPHDTREFLQLCALIPPPLDTALLAHLFGGEERVHALAASVPQRLFSKTETQYRFAHGMIAQSVRQTIPIDVPYRRRIAAALERMRT